MSEATQQTNGITDAMVQAGRSRLDLVSGAWANGDFIVSEVYLAMRALDPEYQRMREALEEARPYVEAYCQEHGATGTLLQAKLVALLAKIDSALSANRIEEGVGE